MSTVVLVPRQWHPQPPDVLYEQFGAGAAEGGWLFRARCDGLRPGAPVAIDVPIGSGAASEVTLLGRIRSAVVGRRIEIVHDLPWSGLISLRFQPRAGGTDLSVTAELDDSGMAWWLEQRGWRTARVDPSAHRLGLLTSRTGAGAVFSVATENLARLAVAQTNAEGGLGGRPVDLVVRDDCTDAAWAASQAELLVAEGCHAIIAGVTSASFAAVCAAVSTRGVPVIHPLLNEGGGAGAGNVIRWGERPLAQVRAASAPMATTGVDGPWFFVGNDYCWSYGAHAAGRRVLAERGGASAGREFAPLGTTDFSDVLTRIDRSDARVVVSSLVGADEVAFERQLAASGLRERCQVLSLVMEESTLSHVGPAAEGVWTAFGYYQQLETPENAQLRQAYADAYGPWAPPLSSLGVSVYEAVLLYAAAVRAARSRGPAEVVRRLHAVGGRMPRGVVRSEGPSTYRQQVRVAQATPTGFALRSS